MGTKTIIPDAIMANALCPFMPPCPLTTKKHNISHIVAIHITLKGVSFLFLIITNIAQQQ